MPGKYDVRVQVPGAAAPLTGSVVVEADPLPRFSPSDRAARQTVLMRIYEWTRALGAARSVARGLVAQRDSLRADLGAATADSLSARMVRDAASIDRAFNAVNAERGPIEGWSGVPTIDQRRIVDNAIEDARGAMTDLNKLISSEVPGAYQRAGKSWSRVVPAVVMP